MPRKKRQYQQPKPPANVTRPLDPVPSSMESNSTPLKQAKDKTKSEHFHMWGTLAVAMFGLIPAYVQMWLQSEQIKDLKRGKSEGEKQYGLLAQQMDVLRSSNDKNHTLQITPYLFVESSVEAVTESPTGEVFRGAKSKLRNVGKGVARNVVVQIHLLRIAEDDKQKSQEDRLDDLQPEKVFSRRTIAPGDSISFDFSHPVPPADATGIPLAMLGTVGLYYQDEEGHEYVATQRFTLKCYELNKTRYVSAEFRTPSLHTVDANQGKSDNRRSEMEAGSFVDQIVKSEHDRLKKSYTDMYNPRDANSQQLGCER